MPKKTHGLSRVSGKKNPFYSVWEKMRYRCCRPGYPGYERWGGRGIAVCERWQSFDNFAEDMLATYSPGLSIERVNNQGHYEPTNCTWATPKTQARNRRTTRLSYVDVVDIRAQYAAGASSQAALARRYGVTAGYVCNIIAGRKWG